MIIDCISDLHGHYPKLEGGDLLIVAGDWVRISDEQEYLDFYNWIRNQKYGKKICIAGNHDTLIQREGPEWMGFEDAGFTYLCDSGTEFKGLKIWGSPWTKTFEGMNPHCKAFTVDTEEKLAVKFSLIPDDVDILVTHSPPFGLLDTLDAVIEGHACDKHVGSSSLDLKLGQIMPKLHVFGHIHEQGGKQAAFLNTRYVNASHVNENYEPVNKPIRIEL